MKPKVQAIASLTKSLFFQRLPFFRQVLALALGQEESLIVFLFQVPPLPLHPSLLRLIVG
jgi:hypothetical protein